MALLDSEVNFLSKLLFIFLMTVSLMITALNGFHGHWVMFYFRVMLLLCSIIPISVRINLDLAKLWYAHGINTDDDIKGTIARNSNIPEELGRIQFLISDKTGTLTQNDMVCRKIFLEYSQFTFKDNKQDMLDMLNSSCRQHDGVASDYVEREGYMVSKRREQQQVLRDMMTALAICNNVTPVDSGPVAADIKKGEDVKILEIAKRSSSFIGQQEQPNVNRVSSYGVGGKEFGDMGEP